MLRLLVVAGLAATFSAGFAHATPSRGIDNIDIGSGGRAVTFGAAVAVPSGYYDLCRQNGVVCRVTSGSKATTPDGSVRLTKQLAGELIAINAQVNRAIRPIEDSQQFGIADRWSVSPKAGDCEDYALTKKYRLLSAGWPSSALLIALATTSWGVEHAVLIVRTDRGDFVLDNLAKQVRGWSPSLYRWEAIQSPNQVWVWSRFGGGTTRVAAAEPAEDQRSEAISEYTAGIADIGLAVWMPGSETRQARIMAREQAALSLV